MDNNISTDFLNEETGRCSDIEELREYIFPLVKSQQEQWKNMIRKIISDCGCSQESFAGRTGFSRQSVNKWCRGSIPRSRGHFIIIGLVAGFDTDGINRLLQRYGRYPALYSKTLEDCVCMYIIAHESGSNAALKYRAALDRIRKRIFGEDVPESSIEYFASRSDGPGDGSEDTDFFDDRLSAVADEAGLERFIGENAAVFSTAYRRLYSYININIKENYGNVADMAAAQKWSSSLRQAVSNISNGKWRPTRNKIISLGLHLCMDLEQVNKMLSLARMEPMCAKNIAESVIIFILENASLNGRLDPRGDEYDPDDLCRYAREVIDELDMPELDIFVSELELPADE